MHPHHIDLLLELEGVDPVVVAFAEGDELAAGNTSAVETFAFTVDAANVPLSVYGALTPDESNTLQSTDVVAIDFDTCVKFIQID